MAKLLLCGDVVPGCDARVSAETEDEILRQAADHVRTVHGMESLDDDTVRAVRGAIRSDA